MSDHRDAVKGSRQVEKSGQNDDIDKDKGYESDEGEKMRKKQ